MENSTLLSTTTNNNNNSNSRRNSNASNSPEFEFWSTSSQLQTPLHSADQLFSDGILLPLHQLTTKTPPSKQQDITPPTTTQPLTDTLNPNPDQNNNITSGSDLKSTSTSSSSKRWKDIFKKNPETTKNNKDTDKKKKKDRTSGTTGGSVGTSTPELNINLWPFSRSRSAGTSGTRPRTVAGNRKVSSAPCSRSNSTGDKYRKWPSSPGRPGVHLGRSSPVWQAKRFGQSRSLHDNLVRNTAEKSSRPTKSSNSGAGVNVPTCMGYRERMSCRSDVIKETGCVAGGNGDVTPVCPAGEGGAASGMFNFRSLFTKKVF